MVTNPRIIFIIVVGLLIYGYSGLLATVFLIIREADPALIGLIATTSGTALGNVSGMLNNTRTQAAPAPLEGTGNGKPQPVVINQPANKPVPVTDAEQPKGKKP